MKVIKTSQFERGYPDATSSERRFRATIYVDVWVPKTAELEKDKSVAREQVEQFASDIPTNSFVGDLIALDAPSEGWSSVKER